MSTTGTLTFLFTDLVGSTELLSRLGDDAAVDNHRQVVRILRLSIGRGREVKNLGDGLREALRQPRVSRDWVEVA